MIVIPVNGKNERMGSLFKTPKHLLLHQGEPAIVKSVRYLRGLGEVRILAGPEYYPELKKMFPSECDYVEPTSSVIATLHQLSPAFIQEDLWIVDCDVIPTWLPGAAAHLDLADVRNVNAVFCFDYKNPNDFKRYSNYAVDQGKIIDCNEKEESLHYAGAGVYHFSSASKFLYYSAGCNSVSAVVGKMIAAGKTFFMLTGVEVIPIGTLQDVIGTDPKFATGNTIHKSIRKRGPTVWNEFFWYKSYLDKHDIPKTTILGLDQVGDYLDMEFIEQDADLDVLAVLQKMKKYSQYPPISELNYTSYRQRICVHMERNPDIHGISKMLDAIGGLGIPATFAHGDLSSRNIISTKQGPRFIDPLYSMDTFGSYVLDIAKLLFSLKYYEMDLANYGLLRDLMKGMDPLLDDSIIDPLIAAECVRVATYNKSFNFIAENLIHEL